MAVSGFFRFLFRLQLFGASIILERFSIQFYIEPHRTRFRPEVSERMIATTRLAEITGNFQAQKTVSMYSCSGSKLCEQVNQLIFYSFKRRTCWKCAERFQGNLIA